MSTVVWSKTAGVIWLETNLCQIILYSLYCSSLKYRRIESGVKSTLVGRIASCASCACLLLPANSFAFSGRYARPQLRDVLPRLHNRIRSDARRVGPHIRNQADRAFVADLHAFV